jgi:hypothetical protein
MSTPWWDVNSWFGPDLTNNAAEVGAAVATGPAQLAASWLTSTAGDMASGLEGAMVAILGDLWGVIAGPLEVLVGVVIIIIVLGWALKNQIIQLGGLALKAAA